MKKLTILSLLPVAIFSMVGCKPKENDNKIFLEFGKVHQTKTNQVSEIDYDTLSSWINNGQTFALAVSNDGCTCWTNFEPILANFNFKYNLDIRHVRVQELNVEGRDRFGLYTVPIDSPFIAFFKQGKLIRQAMYGGNKSQSKIFTDSTGAEFEKFFFENAYLPKMYYVEKETLDSYITENKEFNLYISRGKCGDCSTANKEVLSKWNTTIESVNSPLYVFDIDVYRDTSTEVYQQVKDDYGLSDAQNKEFGWSTGYIPTFQHRKGSTIEDMIVVYNDGLRTEGEDKVLNSYFTNEMVSKIKFLKDTGTKYVLDGMKLNDDQIAYYEGYGYYLKSEVKAQLHNPILELFMNTYVK